MPEDLGVDWDAAEKRRAEKAKADPNWIDWDAAEKRREAKRSAEERSTLGDIMSGAVRSVAIEAPSMALDVAKATEGIARRMVDLPERGPIGEFATEAKEDIQAYADKSPFLRAKEAPGVIAQGVEAAGQSLAMGVPGALAGASVGAMFGPASPITAPLGALVGFALSGGITFGLAEYQNVIDMADKEGIPRSESEPAAIMSGIYEGGFEFLSDIFTGGIMKVTKPLTTPAKEALKTGIRQLFKTTLKDTMVRGAAVMASETSMEMLTAGFQSEQYKKLGLGDTDFWDAAKEAMGPAFVASVIFGGVFAGGAALHRRKIQRNIENGAVKKDTRMQAAAEVEQILKGIDPNLAQAWKVNSAEAIKEGKDIDIDDSDFIRATAFQRATVKAQATGKKPEDITPEEAEQFLAEAQEEVRADKIADTKRYIMAGIARTEITPEEAQAIGRNVNVDIPMQEINQAVMEGMEIERMITEWDEDGLTAFAEEHGLKIPRRVKNAENLAFLVEEHLEEDGSRAVEIAGQIANLEETVKAPDTDAAKANLEAKTEELNKMMPAEEVEDEISPEAVEPEVAEIIEPEVGAEELHPVEEKPAAPEAAEEPEGGKPEDTVGTVPRTDEKSSLEEIGDAGPLPTEKLPEDIKAEAEKTISEDFELNLEGDLEWQLEEMSIDEAVDALPEDFEREVFDAEYDIDALTEDIKERGMQAPVVFGPTGVEGFHRILAAKNAGLKTIPALTHSVREAEKKAGEGQYKIGKGVPVLGDKPLVDEIRKMGHFQKSELGLSPEGHVWWRNKHGVGGKIMSVDHIAPDKAVIKAIYGDIDAKGVHIEGKTEGVDITLNKHIGNRWTIAHENFHVARKLGMITEGEWGATMNKVKNLVKKGKLEFIPQELQDQLKKTPFAEMDEGQKEEFGAYWVQHEQKTREGILWEGGTKAVMQKIADFADMLVNKFVKPTARGVVRKFEKGDIMAREATKEAEAGAQFAIQAQKSPEFKKWFGKSKVADKKGEPLVVYHGTGADEDFDAFDMDETELGAHFTVDPNVASAVAGGLKTDKAGARVIPALLRIENPLRLKDKGVWDDIPEQMVGLGITTQKEVDEFFEDVPRIDAGVREFVEYKGYDGIVYLNRREMLAEGETDVPALRWAKAVEMDELDDDDFGFEIPEARDSYITFHPEQIKSPFNLKPTEDPRIQYALSRKDKLKGLSPEQSLQKAVARIDTLKGPYMRAEEAFREGSPDLPLRDLKIQRNKARGKLKTAIRQYSKKLKKYEEITGKKPPTSPYTKLTAQMEAEALKNKEEGQKRRAEREDKMVQYAISKKQRAAMDKSAEEYPFPKPETTADLIIAHDKKKPEAKKWYEGSKWLRKVFENEGLEDVYRGLAILAHTSRNKSVLANMLEFVKARTMVKHGGIKGDMGLVSKEILDKVLNAETVDEMFTVGKTPTGFRTGEVKVKDFADTFVAVFKDNPELREDLNSVVDIWIGRYFFEDRVTPGGKAMMLTPVHHERIQEHMREVERILTEKTGEKWLPDMAQATLWSYVKDEWMRTGKVEKGFEGISFDESIEILAKRRLGIEKDEPIEPRLVVSYINQVLKDGGKVWLLDHYSKEERKVLDPEFQGTGQKGAEWKAQEKQLGKIVRPNVNYFYLKGSNIEDIFKGMVRHRTVVDTTKIYDMNADPDGIRAKHLSGQPIGKPWDQEKVRDSEEEMIAEGYIGTKFEYTDRTVVTLFEPTRAFPMTRFTMGISPSTNAEQMALLDDIISSDRLKEEFTKEVTDKKTKKKTMVLDKAAYKKANKELMGVRRHLKKINKLMADGKMAQAHKIVSDDVRRIFDHPLIDVVDLSEAQGRYFGDVEPSLHFVIDSGDHDILKGRAGQFLKIYRQSEGIASKYSGFAATDNKGNVFHAAGFPKTEAESTVIKLPAGLSEDDLAKIDGILAKAGLAGSTYTPSLNTLTIHYQKEYSDAWGQKNHKKKVDAANAHRQAVADAYQSLTKEFGDDTISFDQVWFKHDRLLNNWEKDPLGKSYDKLIEEGRIRSTNLGIPDRPSDVERRPRRVKKAPRTKPLYPYHQAKRAEPKAPEVTPQYAIQKALPGMPPAQKAADKWFSKMENFLSQKLPGKGPPKQFKTMITNWANKGQFKQEELAWSGLQEWLDDKALETKMWIDRENGFQVVRDPKGGFRTEFWYPKNNPHTPELVIAQGDGPFDTLADAKDNINRLIRKEKNLEYDPLAIIQGKQDFAKLMPADVKKRTVTKQEVLDYLEANNFRVKEVMLTADQEANEDDRQEAIDYARQLEHESMIGEYDIEWDEEAEPYGYDEEEDELGAYVIYLYGEPLHDSGGDLEVFDDGQDAYEHLSEMVGESVYNIPEDELLERVGYEEPEGGGTKHSGYVTGEGRNYKELLIMVPTSPQRQAQYEQGLITRRELERGQYESGHYPEYPGTMLHVRFDEREGPNGEKRLHIAEIQSDWHQDARKARNLAIEGLIRKKMEEGKSREDAEAEAREQVPTHYGYGDVLRIRQVGDGGTYKTITQEQAKKEKLKINIEMLRANAHAHTNEMPAKDAPIHVVYRDGEFEYASMVEKDAEEFAKMWEAIDVNNLPIHSTAGGWVRYRTKKAVEDEVGRLKREYGGTVPDAPFKMTQAWQMLAMKRMVRYAAENDFDMISWDPGHVQVKRYEEALRKQVDTIRWVKPKKPKKSKKELMAEMGAALDERNALVKQMEEFEFPEDRKGADSSDIQERMQEVDLDQIVIKSEMLDILGFVPEFPFVLHNLDAAQTAAFAGLSIADRRVVRRKAQKYIQLQSHMADLAAEALGEMPAEMSLSEKIKTPAFAKLTEEHGVWEDKLSFLRKEIKAHQDQDKVQIMGLKGGTIPFHKSIRLEGTTPIEGKHVTLEWLLGKDMATKIRESKELKGEFTGEELTIGGEGMKGFYDRMLPAAINKFFNKKPWGKAKVVKIKHEFASGYELGVWQAQQTGEWHLNAFPTMSFKTRNEAVEYARSRSAGEVQALPITPGMRKKAMYEGMPQFALRKDAKAKDTIGAKIQDDIAFKPRPFDFTKDDAKDFAAKLYHLFVMKEYPIVRLAKKTGDQDLIERINKQIRRRRGESGMSEVMLTSDNVQEALKELENDGITEYRHITESLGSILSGLNSEAMYKDYERFRIYERDLALAMYRPDPEGIADSEIKGVNKKKAEKVLGYLKEKYGETEDGRVAVLSEISDKHREFERQAILRPLVESGWMSEEQYENITGRPESEYYASFLREMEEAEMETVGRGKEVVKKIYGSERKKLPSTEGTISNLARTVKIVEEQRLNKMLLEIKNSGADFADMIVEIPPSIRPMPGTWAVYEAGEKKKAKRVFKSEAEAQIYAAGLPGSEVIKRPGGAIPVQYKPDGSIVVAEEGKKKYYSVPKDIQKAQDTHTTEEIHTVMKVLGAPARLLRAGATLSAEFIMRNPVRDQFSAMVYSKYGYNFFTDFGKGIFSMVAHSKSGGKVLRGAGVSQAAIDRGKRMYEEFKAAGGEMSYFVSLDRQKVHMKASQLTGYNKGFKWSYANPVEALRVLSEMMEKGTRLGLYSKAKAKGATPGEAMTEARGATLDFGRIGQIRALNQIIAFWNANVQGTVKMRQELMTKPRKDPKSWKYAQHAITRAALGITVPSIILWAINHDDERYQKLPEWQKNFFWIFPIGTDGPIIRLPKPFEMGLIFGSLPERILDYLYTNDVDEVKSIATAVKDGAVPGMIPTAALPLLEHMTNYSFFRERRLESQTLQRLPVEMRYTPFTSEAAKTIGQMVTLSPVKLENWIRDWTGSLGYTAVAALDPLLASKSIPEVGKRWYEATPGIRGFIARDPRGSSSKTTNKFYDYLEKSAQTAAGHKLLLKSDRVEAKKYYDKNQVHITSAKRARKDATQIAKLRKQQYRVMDSMKPSEQKRKEVDEINRRISDVAERFNKWYKSRGG